MTIKPNNMNKANTYVYLFESSNLCHGRLRQVNYDSLQRLINLTHIFLILDWFQA